MSSNNPSRQFRDALRWILSESGQMVTVEASGTTFIRSLEGGMWCVGILDNDNVIADEREYDSVDAAVEDYVTKVSNLSDW